MPLEISHPTRSIPTSIMKTHSICTLRFAVAALLTLPLVSCAPKSDSPDMEMTILLEAKKDMETLKHHSEDLGSRVLEMAKKIDGMEAAVKELKTGKGEGLAEVSSDLKAVKTALGELDALIKKGGVAAATPNTAAATPPTQPAQPSGNEPQPNSRQSQPVSDPAGLAPSSTIKVDLTR